MDSRFPIPLKMFGNKKRIQTFETRRNAHLNREFVSNVDSLQLWRGSRRWGQRIGSHTVCGFVGYRIYEGDEDWRVEQNNPSADCE